MDQTCKSSSCFFQSKQKTNFEEKKEKISYKIPETELEANLLQNKKNYGKWKLFTKSKVEYTHGTKWVLIKPVDACFTGEFQLN